MSIQALFLSIGALAPQGDTASLPYPVPEPAVSSILAIKVGVAETAGEMGRLEHAVILVEDGKIVTIGEDLPVARGIPILDRDPEWTVTPGLINAYSRLGLDSRAGSEFRPEGSVDPELYPADEVYDEVVEYGITTLGLYPPGNSIPGQATAVRPIGDTKEEMILQDECYLKVILRSNSGSKRALRNAWKKVESYREKDDKAREKWENDNKKKKKKDDDKDDKKKGDEYEPIEPDPQTEVILDLLAGKKRALVSISQSSDYLHFLDACDDNEFEYALRIPLSRESDVWNITERVGKTGCRVVMEPSITLHTGTMRQRNLPAEFAAAGSPIVLVPRSDSLANHRDWLHHTAEMVAAGLDRDAALRGMTIEAAALLGIDDRVGSLEKEKLANMVFFNGDPLEVGTRIEAVMIDGEFVFNREEN